MKLLNTSLTIALTASIAAGQWSDDPASNLAVSDAAADQVQPMIAPTADGGRPAESVRCRGVLDTGRDRAERCRLRRGASNSMRDGRSQSWLGPGSAADRTSAASFAR